jgi:hypothetical protein
MMAYSPTVLSLPKEKTSYPKKWKRNIHAAVVKTCLI